MPFASDIELRLMQLRADLLSGSIIVGRSTQFTIHDPKTRVITAPCFRERVLHHAVMNVCEPVFDRFLINDTYACRTGKGRIACLHRAIQFSRRFPYVVKIDARKYFDSVSHSELKKRLARRFKDHRLLRLLHRIIDAHSTAPGYGLPIGSLTSQHLANFYLGGFDRFVKEALRIPGYVRYMDDCILWGQTSKRLNDHVTASRRFLTAELDLETKPPSRIYRTRHGFPMLGCRVYPNHLKLSQRSHRRFRAKLRQLNEEYHSGFINENEYQDRSVSLCAFATAGGVQSWLFGTNVLKDVR